MVQHKPDSVRIVAPIGSTPGHSGGVGGGVSRTSVQEHNAQLLGLLAQLRDALKRTPSYVLAKALHDSIDSGLGGDKDKDNNKDKEGDHEKEKEKEKEDEEQNASLSLLTKAMNNAIVFIDSVITKQLLAPLLAAITAHLKTILLPLVKEGVVSAPVRTPTHVQHGESIGVDCSRPVQALLTILPDIMKIHILSLHSCPPVTSAVEELGLRILHLYVTIAALIRYGFIFIFIICILCICYACPSRSSLLFIFIFILCIIIFLSIFIFVSVCVFLYSYQLQVHALCVYLCDPLHVLAHTYTDKYISILTNFYTQTFMKTSIRMLAHTIKQNSIDAHIHIHFLTDTRTYTHTCT